MKIFVISDIHGSYHFLEQSLEIFNREKADILLILGDELYHGPRNPLPQDYNPKLVAETLNKYKDKIIAVRGNCDSEVDQMVLDYPITSDLNTIFYNGRRIIATHGHIYNENNLPPMVEDDILIYGHTHLPKADKTENGFILNPGSISLPKEGNPNSYGIFFEDEFKIYSFDGDVIKGINFNSEEEFLPNNQLDSFHK